MPALHNKAAYWIRQGIFDGLVTFSEFESRVNKIYEEKDRGDVFEIFIEGYLATQKIAQCRRHWVVGSVPLELREKYNLPNDGTGIDGLYETHDGSHVAYQIKYRQKENLTFAEVAPFLGITEAFKDRVIFTNAATLSDKALARTRWFNGDDFNALSPNALKLIESWLKELPPPITKAKPDPSYQIQALADIAQALKNNDRTTAVMACGTGKTLLALWAAEQANPKTVLVLVPSLTLLQQTLTEWSEHTNWEDRFSYLCVCSDTTIGLKDDAIEVDKSSVGFPVNTDPNVVRSFLERNTQDIKVIFSTYHSSGVVGEGAAGLPPIDLGIFDEAHKTTGVAGGLFSYALDDKNIKISKRLFLTATPRHYDIRHRDKEGEFRVQSMDDTKVYGERAHTLSFAAAANKGIICKYKVIISLIDKHMVDDFTRKNGITLVDGDLIGVQWMANLIALQQAINKVDAKKIISFHSRVRLAQEFASDETRGIAQYLPDHDVRHVNGAQNTALREEIIKSFRDKPKALLTNARCLTEGVNIPAVDMVAFINPRQSRVDIAQAVGRAMRKPRGPTNKTVGYVLVPLFAESLDEAGLQEAIEHDRFDAVADVINALQEHDEELVDIIREIKQDKGEGKPFNPTRLNEKIEYSGPTINLDQVSRSISIAISDRIGNSWDEWYGALVKFKEREGHCRVNREYTYSGLRLGLWVHSQRNQFENINLFRKQRLNALGFDWDPLSSQWEEGFATLLKFKEREGHCNVIQKYKEGEFNLGNWVRSQRNNIKNESLSEDRKQRLNALGFDWDPLSSQWEEGFAALLKFKEREGHCNVTKGYLEGNFKLGPWVYNQRNNKKNELLSEDRKQRLNALGFDWDPLSSQWEEGFAALLKFKEREGHCNVTKGYLEGNFKLGNWVRNQRNNIKNELLSEDRKQRLNALGFDWDPLSSQWEEGFAALLKFKEREGHCRVAQKYIEGEFNLGPWVASQRNNTKKETLSEDRKQRLNALGFDWDPLSSQWEEGFAALLKFKEREGHCRVTDKHIEGKFKLGSWVASQRKQSENINLFRKQRLNALGFDWDPLSSQWEEGFAALLKFKEREGHCRVAQKYIEGEFNLGHWVANQRKQFEKINLARKQRLNALGFDWDPLSSQWEEGFAALLKFKEREGHCRVKSIYKEGEFNLGNWVGHQRNNIKNESLSEDRKKRLDELGFIWNPKAE